MGAYIEARRPLAPTVPQLASQNDIGLQDLDMIRKARTLPGQRPFGLFLSMTLFASS